MKKESVKNWVRAGHNLHKQGWFDEAVLHYRKALRLDPDFKEICLMMSESWSRAGEHRKALKELLGAFKEDPDNYFLAFLTGSSFNRLQCYKEASKYFRRAVRLNPSFVQAQILLAQTYERMKKYPAALDGYQRILKIRPDMNSIHINIAQLNLFLGRYEESLKHSNPLLKIEPKNSGAWRMRGIALAGLDKPAAALKALNRSVNLEKSLPFPAHPEALLWRGEILRRLNRPEDALKDFHEAEKKDVFMGARINKLLLMLDKNKRACSFSQKTPGEFRDFLEKKLGSMRGRRALPVRTWKQIIRTRCADAQLKLLSGNIGGALNAINALMRLHRGEPQALNFRGEVNLWIGRYRQALRDFRLARKNNPYGKDYVPWARVGMAAAYSKLGKSKQAIQWCKNAIEAGSGVPSLFIWMGETCRKMSRLRQSSHALHAAYRLAPERPCVLLNLALLYGATGNRSLQRAVFNKLYEIAFNLMADAQHSAGFKNRPVQSGHINAVCEKGLDLMRGNRSGWAGFYFTPAGRLRIFERWSPLPPFPSERLPAESKR